MGNTHFHQQHSGVALGLETSCARRAGGLGQDLSARRGYAWKDGTSRVGSSSSPVRCWASGGLTSTKGQGAWGREGALTSLSARLPGWHHSRTNPNPRQAKINYCWLLWRLEGLAGAERQGNRRAARDQDSGTCLLPSAHRACPYEKGGGRAVGARRAPERSGWEVEVLGNRASVEA